MFSDKKCISGVQDMRDAISVKYIEEFADAIQDMRVSVLLDDVISVTIYSRSDLLRIVLYLMITRIRVIRCPLVVRIGTAGRNILKRGALLK